MIPSNWRDIDTDTEQGRSELTQIIVQALMEAETQRLAQMGDQNDDPRHFDQFEKPYLSDPVAAMLLWKGEQLGIDNVLMVEVITETGDVNVDVWNEDYSYDDYSRKSLIDDDCSGPVETLALQLSRAWLVWKTRVAPVKAESVHIPDSELTLEQKLVRDAMRVIEQTMETLILNGDPLGARRTNEGEKR